MLPARSQWITHSGSEKVNRDLARRWPFCLRRYVWPRNNRQHGSSEYAQGIYTRLQSHASGRRSGDQFSVYVADRLVLPTLSHDDINAIALGRPPNGCVRAPVHP
jgi:hypothetical protein